MDEGEIAHEADRLGAAQKRAMIGRCRDQRLANGGWVAIRIKAVALDGLRSALGEPVHGFLAEKLALQKAQEPFVVIAEKDFGSRTIAKDARRDVEAATAVRAPVDEIAEKIDGRISRLAHFTKALKIIEELEPLQTQYM